MVNKFNLTIWLKQGYTTTTNSIQITKFVEGRTSQTKERIISNQMEFPELMICAQNGYKTDALADRELPEDFLQIRSRPTEDNFDFDPESVWDEGTYSMNEFAISWVFIQGKGI